MDVFDKEILVQPDPLLAPFILNYIVEDRFLFVNFTEKPHYFTCRWIQRFLSGIFDSVESDHVFICFRPEVCFSQSPEPSLLNQLPSIAKYTGLKHLPCFSNKISKELKDLQAAFRSDALRIAAEINKRKL